MTPAMRPDDSAGGERADWVSANAFRICFVCSGNICRSPMAETVLRDLARRAGIGDRLEVTSAGTGDWHVGEQADPRTRAALTAAGYDGDAHRARQFEPEWFGSLDLVVALDRSHRRILRSLAPTPDTAATVRLLREFEPREARTASGAELDVPDPYYSDDQAFAAVLELIEHACSALFAQLEPALRLGRLPSHPAE